MSTYVPDEPYFRPQWFRLRPPADIPWLEDEKWVPPGSKALYARARSGLWAIGRDDLGPEATVLVPAFVPRSVVQAFRATGVTVQFYPIRPTLRLPAEEVAERIAAVAPDAVVFVHYFGFADPAFDDLVAAARAVDATVVEDCARTLFSRDPGGTLLGATGDYAVFSLYKVLPVPNGGLVVAADPGTSFPDPEMVSAEHRDALAAVVLRACEAVGVSPARLNGDAENGRAAGNGIGWARDVDQGSPVAAPGWLSRAGLRATDPSDVVAARRRRYAEMRSKLVAVDGLEVLSPVLYDGACPFGVVIRFPDGVTVRDRAYERLHEAGLPCLRLRWGLRPDEQDTDRFPGGQALRRQLLVVPTHQQAPPGLGERVAGALAGTSRA